MKMIYYLLKLAKVPLMELFLTGKGNINEASIICEFSSSNKGSQIQKYLQELF